VLTLKDTVAPWFTLMDVAKPWIVESPAPLISHWLCGVPGRQFSASMVFLGLEQLANALELTHTGSTTASSNKYFSRRFIDSRIAKFNLGIWLGALEDVGKRFYPAGTRWQQVWTGRCWMAKQSSDGDIRHALVM
jgi:hypothetical protein